MKDKITILIADDNPDFARTLTSYIEEDDELEVIAVARDGKQAVEMILNTEPDIALLDVIMPHLDGIGVLEKINEANMKKRPMCIMLSAVGQDKITQRALELGAEYYAIKPIDIEVLLGRIKDIKNFTPSEIKKTYASTREIRGQFIEISSWSASTHKRISIFKRSNNDGSK